MLNFSVKCDRKTFKHLKFHSLHFSHLKEIILKIEQLSYELVSSIHYRYSNVVFLTPDVAVKNWGLTQNFFFFCSLEHIFVFMMSRNVGSMNSLDLNWTMLVFLLFWRAHFTGSRHVYVIKFGYEMRYQQIQSQFELFVFLSRQTWCSIFFPGGTFMFYKSAS